MGVAMKKSGIATLIFDLISFQKLGNSRNSWPGWGQNKFSTQGLNTLFLWS